MCISNQNSTKMHLRKGLILVVFIFRLCAAFILAEDEADRKDIEDDADKRIKRGLFDGYIKVLGKAGKFAPLIWRVFKAKRVLLKDAKLVKKERGAGVYTKEGGKGRAEKDFAQTLPTIVKMIDTDEGAVRVGYIDNYEVALRYWKSDVNVHDTEITTKYTIRIVKISYTKEFADVPLFVHYLD